MAPRLTRDEHSLAASAGARKGNAAELGVSSSGAHSANNGAHCVARFDLRINQVAAVSSPKDGGSGPNPIGT